MDVFWTVVFALIFFALLMASVALHEIGHLLPAKAFGVAVPKYFVGFGKTLWSTRRGESRPLATSAASRATASAISARPP